MEMQIRKCGAGWEYCNGDCSKCDKSNITYSNATDEKSIRERD
jgi:hypothetical protein